MIRLFEEFIAIAGLVIRPAEPVVHQNECRTKERYR